MNNKQNCSTRTTKDTKRQQKAPKSTKRHSMTAKGFLSQYDLFGTPFRFFAGSKGATIFTTAVGGLSTTLCLTICCVSLYIFGKKYLDRTKAIVSVNTKTQSRDHYYNTYDNDVYFLFGMFDGQNFPKTEETPKFMTIKGQRETTFLDQKDIQIKRKIEDPFEMVKCEHLSHNVKDLTAQAYSEDSARFYRGAIFCGDILWKTNWWLQGSPLELPYTMIRYRLYPCSLENPADCASVNELAAASLVIPVFLKSVDYSNFSNPLKNGVNTDITPKFSAVTKTKMTFWFKDTTIHDDVYEFFWKFWRPQTLHRTGQGHNHYRNKKRCSPLLRHPDRRWKL